MNIVIFLTYGVSLKSWDDSGLLSREMKLYTTLTEIFDIKFTFVTYGDESDLMYESRFRDVSIIPMYRYKKRYKNKFITLLQTIFLPFLVKNIKGGNIDIIKTNQLMGSWSPIILKLITKKPLLVRTGYDLYLFSKKDKKNILKKFTYYLLTFLALNLSDLYTVSSKSDYNFILGKYFFNKKKLLIRKNWVNPIRQNEEVHNRSKEVLSVGRLEPQKDFQTLVTLFSKSDIKLDIIGEGSLKAELESTKSNNINILNRVDNEELLKTYLKYRIFISFSNYEGNPKTILEAMGSRCLVIAANIPNNAEIIEDGKNGILIQNKDESVFNTINYFLRNPKKMKEITNNGYDFVKNHHSLEKYVQTEYDDYCFLTM